MSLTKCIQIWADRDTQLSQVGLIIALPVFCETICQCNECQVKLSIFDMVRVPGKTMSDTVQTLT